MADDLTPDQLADLQAELDHLEATDPAVADAAARYDAMSATIRSRPNRGAHMPDDLDLTAATAILARRLHDHNVPEFAHDDERWARAVATGAVDHYFRQAREHLEAVAPLLAAQARQRAADEIIAHADRHGPEPTMRRRSLLIGARIAAGIPTPEQAAEALNRLHEAQTKERRTDG